MKKIIMVGGIGVIVMAIFVMRTLTSTSEESEISLSKVARGGLGVTSVQISDVKYGPIQLNREFTGTIRAAFTYVIAAKISGRMVTINKRIGDRVGADETVAMIDDTEYRQAYLEAKAQVAVSKASVSESEAQVKYAEKDMYRISELVSKGISSQAELDAVETQFITQKSRLDLAKAQLAQRQVVLDQALTRLNYTSIKSAQAGYTAIRHTDGGALLSVNSPVLTIVGMDTVYVEISVPERDYPNIAKGQDAFISVDALPDRVFTGKVTSASPLFQTETRTAVVEISVVNDSMHLKPGMFARINLVLAKKDSAQIIPFAAMVNRSGSDAVFVVNEKGTAELVKIKTGFIDEDKIEVLSPVILGKVITMGNHLLTDGAKINIISEAKTGITDAGKPEDMADTVRQNKVNGSGKVKK